MSYNQMVPNTSTRIIRNESLLATDTEKHSTSKSLYGDSKARISSNVSAIHDRVRLNACKSILPVLRGKSVLHLGCGMGLISMMIARAAAKHVVAVDTSAIVDCARVVAEQNNLSNITFLKGDVRSLDLTNGMAVPKFDIILCEWMGAFLTNEDVLEDLVYCRDNLLMEGGILCPDKSSIHVAGVSDYSYHLDTVQYWENVYGFTMKPMQRLVTEEASTCHIPRHCIATNSCKGPTIDISKYDREKDKQFEFDFVITAVKKATLHFITFYVDCSFTHPTEPTANYNIDIKLGGMNTWTEVSVPLEEHIPVAPKDIIKGKVSVHPRGKVTEIIVSVSCEGSVATTETSGKYYYTY
eukprot:Tbor_TRINITY_DN5619_c0_g4::TRINITY_DN5619_c0_g4_i1::g.8391::m.8391/K11434/PRMT1; type I protein arginine methyltransferase